MNTIVDLNSMRSLKIQTPSVIPSNFHKLVHYSQSLSNLASPLLVRESMVRLIHCSIIAKEVLVSHFHLDLRFGSLAGAGTFLGVFDYMACFLDAIVKLILGLFLAFYILTLGSNLNVFYRMLTSSKMIFIFYPINISLHLTRRDSHQIFFI